MKLLVPIDFTPVTENALRYAIQLPTAQEIILFHVVSSAGETKGSTGKLEELSSKYASTFSGKIECHVTVGNIFDHIGEEALNNKCDLIIMGTHGVKGMQHLVGSRAMRVITNSKTPYIVVQNNPYEAVKRILVPVDFTKEGKQVLPILVSIAQLFGATLSLLPQKTGRDEFIRNKVDNNLSYFKSVFETNRCQFELLSSEFTYEKRYKEIMKAAREINPQMIVSAIDPSVDVADYIMGVDEQKMVANEDGIPVLCINIRQFTRFTGSIFEGSA
jgi:nucleotide-binding universal stress UspA family protein